MRWQTCTSAKVHVKYYLHVKIGVYGTIVTCCCEYMNAMHAMNAMHVYIYIHSYIFTHAHAQAASGINGEGDGFQMGEPVIDPTYTGSGIVDEGAFHCARQCVQYRT